MLRPFCLTMHLRVPHPMPQLRMGWPPVLVIIQVQYLQTDFLAPPLFTIIREHHFLFRQHFINVTSSENFDQRWHNRANTIGIGKVHLRLSVVCAICPANHDGEEDVGERIQERSEYAYPNENLRIKIRDGRDWTTPTLSYCEISEPGWWGEDGWDRADSVRSNVMHPSCAPQDAKDSNSRQREGLMLIGEWGNSCWDAVFWSVEV